MNAGVNETLKENKPEFHSRHSSQKSAIRCLLIRCNDRTYCINNQKQLLVHAFIVNPEG